MTVESVLAHGLKTSVFGTQWNVEHGDNLALLDPDRITSDLLANRPVAGVAHRFFFATDNQKLYYDTGAAWVEPSLSIPAHATSHAGGGGDAVTLAQSQVTNLAADLAAKEPANANIQAHIANAANPHAVTKAQVGLGNADNTSDAAKPVSTAAQTALNLKANDSAVPHLTGNESIGGVKSFTDMVKFSRGVQVASAADLRVDTNADGIYFNVTGTTTITSIHTLGATGTGAAKGILPLVILKFDGILTLTHSASLMLPGAANITTYAGLVITFVEESAAVWRCISGLSLPVIGVTDGSGAAAGVVGEYLNGTVASTTNFGASGTWADVTFTGGTMNGASSIVLPAGDWDISLALTSTANGATVAVVVFGLGTAPGNSSTGIVYGDTAGNVLVPNSTVDSFACIANIRKSISTQTTYYFKILSSYSVATPKFQCRVSCRRAR